MRIRFEASFAKDLRRIKDATFKKRVAEAIRQFEAAETLVEISNLKRLKDTSDAYRLRVGKYRLGLLSRDGQMIFVRVLHRKDIYKYFP